MSIFVEFGPDVPARDQAFESFTHLRDILRGVAFAPVYRMRTHQDEFGRVTSRDLFAVCSDEQEVRLGSIFFDGEAR